MNSSAEDYRKLFRLQDKFLAWWKTLNYPLYLTGGTALGRFYLNHRASDDLDFFCNANPEFTRIVSGFVEKVPEKFNIDKQQTLATEDFARLFLLEENLSLKIELVNDVSYYPGHPVEYKFGLIDTPLNILSNKLSALIGRDDPKDVFDIVHIALSSSFNWHDIFRHTKEKAVVNEIDIEEKLISFSPLLFENMRWLYAPPDIIAFENHMRRIADDFLLGKDNSLGINCLPINKIVPKF